MFLHSQFALADFRGGWGSDISRRMKNPPLGIASFVVSTAAVFFVAPSAQAAGTISFDTGNLLCFNDNSFSVAVTNGTTASVPGGTAILGSFTGHYSAIPVGATVNIALTSTSNWTCNNVATSLKLKTASGLYTIPAARETTMTRMRVASIQSSTIHLEGDPYYQYVSCDEGGGSYWVETWASFPGSPGTEEYSFSGAIFSPWWDVSIGLSHQTDPLDFFFDDVDCPHVADSFTLTIDPVNGSSRTTSGIIEPYWEELTGSRAF